VQAARRLSNPRTRGAGRASPPWREFAPWGCRGRLASIPPGFPPAPGYLAGTVFMVGTGRRRMLSPDTMGVELAPLGFRGRQTDIGETAQTSHNPSRERTCTLQPPASLMPLSLTNRAATRGLLPYPPGVSRKRVRAFAAPTRLHGTLGCHPRDGEWRT
jgi:hypothetical protein